MKNALALALLLFAMSAQAKELKGVKMDDQVTVGGKALKLNGLGLRSKAIFKVYVGGLYLENPTQDPAQVISSEQTKRVVMHMMRDVPAQKITEAIQEGFQKNAKASLPALQERLDRFTARVSDLKDQQRLTITYYPEKGTVLTGASGQEITLEGKDFAQAMFSVWFGSAPVDEALKKGMLGL